MNADAEPHPLPVGTVLVLVFDRFLDRDGALDRIDRAREVSDDTIASGVEDSTAMSGNQSIENHPVGLQSAQSADLVQPHQAAVLGNIGRENCGELSLDDLAFYHPSSSAPLIPQPMRSTRANIAFFPRAV